MSPLRWSLSFFASLLLLPFAPALLVALIGFGFPGIIPWSIVEGSLPIAALASFVVCCFLLYRGPWPVLFRILAALGAAVMLSFVARTEVIMQAECGPPRGKYIDFQRQYQESQFQGAACG